MTGCNVLLSVGIVREARLKKEGGYRIPNVSQCVHLIRIGVNIIYGCDTIDLNKSDMCCGGVTHKKGKVE